MLHPATLLVLWAGLAFTLQTFAWIPQLIAAGLALACATLFALERLRRLLWRSRWLFLSLTVLFLFFTPGEYLADFPGAAGMTQEGVALAVTHISLLIALLASLAVLHQSIGTRGLLAGLYGLLRPLGVSYSSIVRLMLVLDFVEAPPPGGWRDWLGPDIEAEETAANLSLEMPEFCFADRALIFLAVFGVLYWVVMR